MCLELVAIGTFGLSYRLGICECAADERNSECAHVAGGRLPYAAAFVGHDFIYAAE